MYIKQQRKYANLWILKPILYIFFIEDELSI